MTPLVVPPPLVDHLTARWWWYNSDAVTDSLTYCRSVPTPQPRDRCRFACDARQFCCWIEEARPGAPIVETPESDTTLTFQLYAIKFAPRQGQLALEMS